MPEDATNSMTNLKHGPIHGAMAVIKKTSQPISVQGSSRTSVQACHPLSSSPGNGLALIHGSISGSESEVKKDPEREKQWWIPESHAHWSAAVASSVLETCLHRD